MQRCSRFRSCTCAPPFRLRPLWAAINRSAIISPHLSIRASIILAAHAGTLLFIAMDDAHGQACGTLSGLRTAGAVCAPAAGTAAIVTTTDGTTIDNASLASIRATGTQANASVSITGTSITNRATTAVSGVQAQVNGGTGSATVTFAGGTSNITMAGSGTLDGVAVLNNTSGQSSILVNAGTTLNIDNPLSGNDRDGLDINASGGGDATIVHQGAGTISTAGGSGLRARTSGAGNVTVQAAGGITLNVDNTNGVADPDDPGVEAGPANHAGIHAKASGSGAINVDTAAMVRAIATNAFGILTEGSSGATLVHNSGALTSDGLNGFGIRSTATTGSIEIRNEGAITTTGPAAHGIYANSSSGAITVDNRAPIAVGSTANADGSRGINIIARGAGAVNVTGTGDITVQGNVQSQRGSGIIISAEQGDISVAYSGGISVRGFGAGGIRADTAGGNVSVNYTGNRIETFHSNANGIYATARSATGTVDIAAQGTIVTHSDNGSGDGSGVASFGLQGVSQGGNVRVSFAGPTIDVNGSGAAILAANAYDGTGLGTVTVDNGGALIARGDRQQGIHTRSLTGEQTITNTAAIQTSGPTASQAILAEGTGAAAIHIVNSGALTASGNNASGIDAQTAGGTVDIRNSQTIAAGWGSSAGIQTAGASQTIDNTSAVGALSDVAIRADANGSAGTLLLSNSGQITGTVTAASSAVTMTNGGTWNLRAFSDSTGTGTRDRWAVAVSNLGTNAANSIVNSGSVVLAAQPGATLLSPAAATVSFDAAGAYLPFGQAANAPTQGGAVQGQILGVRTFTNGGVLDLTGGARVAGNVLVITGGQTAGQDGAGVFISNGGVLKLNTVLNEGAANSKSDVLVVDATSTGAGGPTRLRINNVGGAGAVTQGNGIGVVEVLNTAPGASAPNAFTLDGRAVAGAYEYRLFQGGVDGSQAGSWYLRSMQMPPPAPPTPPEPLFRPEVAAYLANQRLTGQMFVHSLHDRLGEPQYVEGQGFDPAGDKPRSGWLRVVGKWEGSRSADGVFKTSTDSFLLHGGTELARWNVFGESDRGHLGLMGSYGMADSDASAQGNPFSARGKVEGWSIGAYGTWYQNDEKKLGTYVDSWLQYGWFTNRVEGDLLPTVRYHARGWAASGEVGYATPLRNDWILEPQGQVIYVGYNEDDITEQNGTQIGGADSHGWITRLGARVHRTYVREDARKWQPYMTLNWWHTSVSSSIRFNDLPVGSLYPSNRYELKLGVNADLGKRWTGWSNVSGAWGAQSFYQYAVRVGVKYTW
ncbi:autotransporter outer membrane beta-barrel domain-containing protein [Cupriavidus pinatubonensis]|uniref:autotransporter outer membrane beta-barrel domain-containing protein n=1 Tax=Cupriavidus pinatubonensis TaxID=248026 RepID=UPI00112A8DF7|nr:autotransporter outer membrane beta-barrel domain-containing protein [Cupriavidus pinatubonensis]QYY31987.1 autotransporter outer membrane beta-barrel domain-containing protein [Cupriavidus pinatubonensis]TPQ41949.1 autotransporter outer membrane beta-barrel domain-containing protein [Cupriavidus pinatubonensis]